MRRTLSGDFCTHVVDAARAAASPTETLPLLRERPSCAIIPCRICVALHHAERLSIRLQGREQRQDYVKKLDPQLERAIAEALRLIDEYPALEPKPEERPRRGR